MALTVTKLSYGASATSSSTLTVNGGFPSDITASVGDMLVVFVSAENNGTNGAASLSSVSDSAGNTYTNRGITNYDPGAARAGVTLGIFTTLVTSAITAGSITVNFSPNTQYKAAVVYLLEPTTGYTPTVRFVGSGATGNEGSTPISITTSSLSTDDVVFGVAAWEEASGFSVTGDSDTTRGTWNSISGGFGTDWFGVFGTPYQVILLPQYKTVTSAGTQTWDASISGANPDYAANYIAFYESLNTPTYSLAGDGGTYSISEDTTANLAYGRIFAADTTSYGISGTAATLTYAKAIFNDGGSYSITGSTANLLEGGAPTGYTYSVNAGSYEVVGIDVSFVYNYEIAAEHTDYIINGQIAQLTKGRTLEGGTAAYAISGTANSFLYGRVFLADTSSYSVSGTANSWLRGYTTVGDAGSYSVTGGDVIFGAGQRRFNVLSGSYSISGKKTALFKTYTTSLRPLDPRYSFWNSPDGMHNVYPEFISFAKYIRRPQNTNGNGNIIVSTRAGSGLFDSYGHLRVNIVDGSAYVGMYAADGAVNAKIINREDTDPDQLFDGPSGALRIVEATVDDYGAISPNNGAMFVVNLLD